MEARKGVTLTRNEKEKEEETARQQRATGRRKNGQSGLRTVFFLRVTV